jgi:hypothetical protein
MGVDSGKGMWDLRPLAGAAADRRRRPRGPPRPHAADLARGRPDPAVGTLAPPPRRHRSYGQQGWATPLRRQEEGPAAAVLEARAEARPTPLAAVCRGGREGRGAHRTGWVTSPVALAGATQADRCSMVVSY